MSNREGYITITPFFGRNAFSHQSVTVSEDLIAQITQLPTGGKFIIRSVKPVEGASRTRPTHYLEYVTAEQLANEKEAYLARKAAREEESL